MDDPVEFQYEVSTSRKATVLVPLRNALTIKVRKCLKEESIAQSCYAPASKNRQRGTDRRVGNWLAFTACQIGKQIRRY
jgi:hypothetical protein